MKKEASKKWIIPVVVAVVAIVTVAILLVTGVIGSKAKVPDILNKSVTEAEKILEEAGFAICITKTEINDDVPENTVLVQSPVAGEKLEKGSVVDVTSSVKSVSISIPNVKYYSKELAVDVLQKTGFKVEIKTENSTEIADGAVISQSQTGEGKTGSLITLSISANSVKQGDAVKVPSVADKTAEDAAKALKGTFFFKITEEKFSDTVKNGKVIAQTPQADTNANQNITINAVISLGKAEDREVIVPNVIRFSRSQAKEALENAGLRVVIKEEASDTIAKGVVVSQNIKGGLKVKADTVVTIVVSSGKAQATSATTTLPTPTKFETTKKQETTKNNNQNVAPTQKPIVPPSTQKPTDPSGEAVYRSDFSIVTDKKEAKAGDIITVSVKLKTNYNIVAISLPVIYDARAFELVGTEEDNLSSFLKFSGKLTQNGYQTNGNWKSPDTMYSKNSNPDYWTNPLRKANNKIVFATWVAMASQGTSMTSLDKEETIVSFKLKVKENVKDTSGRIYMSPDFIKTASDPQGILFVGRSKSDSITVDSIVQTGQTINLDKANSLVVIK